MSIEFKEEFYKSYIGLYSFEMNSKFLSEQPARWVYDFNATNCPNLSAAADLG